ncbi:type II toxin-antitoxin system PemK/MazF family toxin [Bdellovibrionota bacterium FG-2]
MICEQFDVVVVPFPFSDLPKSKKRKALVISSKSFNKGNENSVLLMITSAHKSKWHFDVPVSSLAEAGLHKDCVVRMKTFTLDNGLLLERAGRLGSKDASQVIDAFKKSFSLG